MDPEDLQESQATLEKMGCLVIQVQRDPGGCLVSQAFQEREEIQAQQPNQAEKEKSDRRAGLAFQGTQEPKVPKEPEDFLEMKVKWPSFPKEETLGNLGLLEMGGSQEREVTKEFPGYKGEEASRGDMDHLDFREGSLADMGSVGFRDPLALRVHQG